MADAESTSNGGLEEPGYRFARYLAQGAPAARLIFLEPAGFPPREEWDEWLRGDAEGLIGRRLARLSELEALGAEVLVAGADLGDEAAVRGVVAAGEERWGDIHGMILAACPRAGHAAGEGLGDDGGSLAERLRGALALDAVRRERRLDFALLLGARARGAGASDAAEAMLLDAFAAASDWTGVAWGLTREAGGSEVVGRLLTLGPLAQAVAAVRPLAAGWSPLDGLPAEEAGGEVRQAVGFYPRPNLRVELVLPRNPTEEYIAAIWKDLLGVAEVGVYDNFLTLGGDSLLATRLVSRMRDTFHLDLPVRLFFERSTVAELAEAVEEARARLRAAQESELLEKVNSLSEEELEMEILRLENLLTGEEVTNG